MPPKLASEQCLVTDTPAAQRTQEQRWAAIFHGVKSMSSAAHHDDSTTEGFSSDTEAILATTTGCWGGVRAGSERT
jgi:hypothetical protein